MRCSATIARVARAVPVGLILCEAVLPVMGVGLLRAETPAPLALEQRIACQRAVEEVYWRHRTWPDTNPRPKPPLSAVLSEAELRRKVEDALSKSSALDTVWERPITGPQLQAEIEHMARSTRNPEMLRELWDGLGNDPVLVAECLARPMLADRLIRNWYAFDDRFHGHLRARVASDLAAHRTVDGMRAMSGRYEEQVWRKAGRSDEAASAARDSSWVRILGEDEWLAELAGLREALGSERARLQAGPAGLPVRTLGPLQEDEHSFYVTAVLEQDAASLTVATVTWPKVSFDDWWETRRSEVPPPLPDESGSGAALPQIVASGCTDDAWTPLPFVPKGRDMHVTVWTGSETLIWGGDFVEGENVPGGRYDPATDTWHPINAVDAPTMRQLATAVWTGTEMIVWGGWGGGTSENVKSTGARYDPITDSWTPTSSSGSVPSPRFHHTAVWTGREMIVWGGCTTVACFTTLNTGGRYDPRTDSWTPVEVTGAPSDRYLHTAVWSGSVMIVWGGERPGSIFSDGGRYDPATDTWSTLTPTGAPAARSLHTAVWTGTRMIVWGGCRSSACFYPLLDSGGRYDPATDSWSPTSVQGAPYQRRHHTAVWTGSKMIVWGGCVDADCSDFRDTGGRYDPSTDSWSPTDTTTDPGARAMHTAVWTGSEMIVWGGCYGGQCEIEMSGGGRYDPATDSWVPTGGSIPPVGRIYHSAVWTGSELIVWGGQASSATNDGTRYDLVTDRWTAVTRLGAPAARERHGAVWTGTRMIVWGGNVRFAGAVNTGGAYDPVTNSWTPTSTAGAPPGRFDHTTVWTGTEMMVWGGWSDPSPDTVGGRYDPVSDSWTPTSTVGAPSGRLAHSSVWTGGEVIVWGGCADESFSCSSPLDSGGRYDPGIDSWSPTSTVGAPDARRFHTAVWGAGTMIVWGGLRASGASGDGARYDPVSDAWTPVSLSSAPARRHSHSAVWTGTEMIVWGGEDNGTSNRTGGRYDPAGDRWSPTSTGSSAPVERSLHSAAWTGSEMIVWGGLSGTGRPETGARYCVAGSPSSSPGSTDGLRVARSVNGTDLDLAWNASCSGQATDYAVYEGVVGSWYSHSIKQCSTGGPTSTTLSPAGGDRYYLVVPLGPASEGSYGCDSTESERPRAPSACLATQNLAPCP